MGDFQRARSAEAKQSRRTAILDAARDLATAEGVREVTLTSVAARIGMHKSALLRYFETREQILLDLAAIEWRDWGPAVERALDGLEEPDRLGAGIAQTLIERPLFCDLLAYVPLSLERNVSIETVRAFKLVTFTEVRRICASLRRAIPRLTEQDGIDVVAAATWSAGSMWQIANPGAELENLYRSDPRLAHARMDVGPRLTRILGALIRGLATPGPEEPARARTLPRP